MTRPHTFVGDRALGAVCLLAALVAIQSCGQGDAGMNQSSGESPSGRSGRQLNVTLLLDLSDRISNEVYPAVPSHADRDLAAIQTVVDEFVRDMRLRGAFEARGRIRTVFSPPPADPTVDDIARSLSIDLTSLGPADKKRVHDSLGVWYQRGLRRIYDTAARESDFAGADIWRFFREGQAQRYAVAADSGFRNVVVILTDGYVYHANSTSREANRTAFVTGPLLDREGLRGPQWRRRFDAGDYGLIDADVALANLDVLVLEVNPSDAHPDDFEVLRAYWNRWFEEMAIGKWDVIQTDLPTNTAPLIQRFFRDER